MDKFWPVKRYIRNDIHKWGYGIEDVTNALNCLDNDDFEDFPCYGIPKNLIPAFELMEMWFKFSDRKNHAPSGLFFKLQGEYADILHKYPLSHEKVNLLVVAYYDVINMALSSTIQEAFQMYEELEAEDRKSLLHLLNQMREISKKEHEECIA